jgi:hypothetical protein
VVPGTRAPKSCFFNSECSKESSLLRARMFFQILKAAVCFLGHRSSKMLHCGLFSSLAGIVKRSSIYGAGGFKTWNCRPSALPAVAKRIVAGMAT